MSLNCFPIFIILYEQNVNIQKLFEDFKLINLTYPIRPHENQSW